MEIGLTLSLGTEPLIRDGQLCLVVGGNSILYIGICDDDCLPRETPPHTRTARAQPPAAHRRRHSRPHHRRHGEHSPTALWHRLLTTPPLDPQVFENSGDGAKKGSSTLYIGICEWHHCSQAYVGNPCSEEKTTNLDSFWVIL